ncbi:lipopolysaccharide kinase InaA family protein [Stratiformator vulcanicus]|uniref:Lipopolysaccharide core heptose(I) kinase RfaP n=1 Tax=Stratiformator vulcanicus TaxID=2527980 RepID=A0A517QX39_9PLAN|nr:lipopolysaccharide kinase InaA family protein [Stratiformator vulcanicus]QDT36164.1 Lipopolysaccharide core heptose(I) kinase RfaP [Stratiformator vulcanicus]
MATAELLAPIEKQRSSATGRVLRQQFWMNPEFAEVLVDAELDSFAALIDTDAGEAMRLLGHRENWRLTLNSTDGQFNAYLKKHRQQSISRIATAYLGGLHPSPAAYEATMNRIVSEAGIPTMNVIAYGSRVLSNGTTEGVFLSEELKGFEQLDLFLEERFQAEGDRKSPAFHRLIDRVADVAGRFHQAGFNHRDFYTCHFFVREREEHHAEVDFDVHLIDLQRVQHWPSLLRRRWIVKDLGQFIYSCPQRLFGRDEFDRFFRRYFSRSQMTSSTDALRKGAEHRADRMTRRLGSYR